METSFEIRGRAKRFVSARLWIDTRSLAAFRVSLGLVVIVNLVARTRDLRAFYTDSGAVPRSAAYEASTLAQYSLHSLSGSVEYQAFLFLVTAVFAAAFVVGYRTRVASVALFVLVVSLHVRNPLVMNGGDALLTRLLLWSLFLPLGERWSVDARRRDGGRDHVVSVATAALLLQVVLVYAVNGVFKLRSDVWMSGDAVPQVFELTAYTTWLGTSLAEFPVLLVFLNYFWVTLLVASPLLLLFRGWGRVLLAALFAGAQVGLLFTMHLAVFPLVSLAGLIAFTPSVVWNRTLPHLSRPRAGLSRITVRLNNLLPGSVVPVSLTGSLGSRAEKWKASRWRHRAVSSVVTVLILTVLVTNASALGYVETPQGAEEVESYVGTKWSLFAPYPPAEDRWYAARGETESGRLVEPIRLSGFETDQRPDAYRNARWRKYLDSVRGTVYLKEPLGEYLCERWERNKDSSLTEVKLYFVRFDESVDRNEVLNDSC